MVNFLLFVFNVVIKFYNAFAIHKAIGKQVSLTRIFLSGVFGIFSHTLTQLIALAQETDNSSDDNDTPSHQIIENNTTKKKKQKVKRQYQPQNKTDINMTESPFILDDDDNDVYVDTNYKLYQTTVRRSNKGLQLKNFDSKNKKPEVP